LGIVLVGETVFDLPAGGAVPVGMPLTKRVEPAGDLH